MMSLFDHNHIAVFTDGSSFIKKNYYEASSGIIISINGEKVCEFGCFHNNGTNSLGEIYAMMLAIERVEEIKQDNPELRDYDTYFISDSKYVVTTFNEWVYNWASINKYKDIWISSSKSPIAYQWLIKYIYFKYLINKKWKIHNYFIHTNGHVNYTNKSSLEKYYKKFMYRNYIEGINPTIDEYKYIVTFNDGVDQIADYIRKNKLFYYEKIGENSLWVIRKKRIPTRNQMIIIKSRRNESRI